ncbi:MAG: hypothetical protein NT018_05500 [Armatimonadetes bacterium]|nr:hypothetical protein [Armatimonadota bacterium]
MAAQDGEVVDYLQVVSGNPQDGEMAAQDGEVVDYLQVVSGNPFPETVSSYHQPKLIPA